MYFDSSCLDEAIRMFASAPSFFINDGKINLDCVRLHIIRCLISLRCYEYFSRDTTTVNEYERLFYTTVSEIAETLSDSVAPATKKSLTIQFLEDNFTYIGHLYPPKEKIEVNENNRDWMPVYWAIINKSASCTQKLCDVDEAQALNTMTRRSECEASLMHFAAASQYGYVDVTKALVSPAAVRSEDRRGRVPLHWVALYSTSLPMLDYLLEEWPEAIEVQDAEEHTPLHLLVERTAFPEQAAMIARLVDADPTSCSIETYDQTPLDLFCRNESISDMHGEDVTAILNKLLAAHPSAASLSNLDSNLPLHVLCHQRCENKLSLIQILLSENKDAVFTKGEMDFLPAHFAAQGDCIETLQCLLEVYPEALSVEANSTSNILSVAAENGSKNAFKYLLERKPELARFPEKNGKLPLHEAAKMGDLECVKLTYAAYPDAAKTFMKNGLLPLHMPFFTRDPNKDENVEIVRFLLWQCSQTANMRKVRGNNNGDGEEEDIGDDGENGGDDDDDAFFYEESIGTRIKLTPYQLSRRNADSYLQRLFLIACPEIDPERLRKLTYDARRPLMFLAFAARTNAKAALRLSSSSCNASGARLKADGERKEEINDKKAEFIYHLRRVMNIGNEMGLLRHIAAYL